MKKSAIVCLVAILMAIFCSCVAFAAKTNNPSPEASKYSKIDNDDDKTTATKSYNRTTRVRRTYPTQSQIYTRTTKPGKTNPGQTSPGKTNPGQTNPGATTKGGKDVPPRYDETTVINGKEYVTDRNGNVLGEAKEFETDKNGYYIIPDDYSVTSDKSHKSPSTGSSNSTGIVVFALSFMSIAAGAVVCSKKKSEEN